MALRPKSTLLLSRNILTSIYYVSWYWSRRIFCPTYKTCLNRCYSPCTKAPPSRYSLDPLIYNSRFLRLKQPSPVSHSTLSNTPANNTSSCISHLLPFSWLAPLHIVPLRATRSPAGTTLGEDQPNRSIGTRSAKRYIDTKASANGSGPTTTQPSPAAPSSSAAMAAPRRPSTPPRRPARASPPSASPPSERSGRTAKGPSRCGSTSAPATGPARTGSRSTRPASTATAQMFSSIPRPHPDGT